MKSVPAWLEGARLAPSAHNTQPWRFRPLPSGDIQLRWLEERALPISDPTSRDLFLGLGAAIEAACLQSAARGTSLQFHAAVDLSARVAGHLIPTDKEAREEDVELAGHLERRHTARIAHLPKPLPVDVISALSEQCSRWNRSLHVLSDRGSMRKLASLARKATAAMYADSEVHEELWQWLRLDPNSPSFRRDGLTADCLDLSGATLTIARLAMPPRSMHWLRRLGVHQLLATDMQRVVGKSASVCLLTTPSLKPEDLLETGRLLLRIWLLATKAGLTTHPISALIDYSPTVRPSLELFGAQGELPAALFRMGATNPVPRAPRLPAQELVEA